MTKLLGLPLIGRKPSVEREKVLMLRKQGIGATEIASRLKIGRSTVYQVLNSIQKSPKLIR